MSASAGTTINSPRTFSPRQDQILDAAQICFVRNGYNRSTMQDIAKEAAMSSPNIYRYFVSKEAVLVSIADREKQRADDRIWRFEAVGDKYSALMRIIEYYQFDVTREHATLRLEIWSEATRNPEVDAIVREREKSGRDWLANAVASIATSPDCDPHSLFEAISALLKGIIVCRALFDDYNVGPAVAQLHALIEAGLAGRMPEVPRRTRSVDG
ncbi:TetR/AcrR family transcriptional regulator [Methylobacterium sp. J-090]|uniref:TetR/AcrR family transcriptional regulator n=1 Tax=Methylobacterium sp. J-090 TaxID=2836666 RepID=UPI001FB8A6A6|nr:TetR/AcrR family transcriptional regulator [Methylobacterium sp. J-090]MCJ2081852.1 TetR/AcrR family transcriptional regulator [Methylobacterium sp. J-090]